MIRTFGADVSHWEGLVDWSTAGQWLPFTYFKCTEGTTYVDPSFVHNKKGCLDAGIPHAPYHFFKSRVDPVQQAEFFFKQAGPDYIRYILDVEEEPQDPITYDYQAAIRKFISHFKQLSKRTVAIYTSSGFWNTWMLRPWPNWCFDMDLILAHYTIARFPTMPGAFKNWKIWQFTDNFWFPGCTETADGNWFNGSLFECRQWFGNHREVDPPAQQVARYRSHFNNLNIRQAPSIQSRSVGKLKKGEIVEVLDIAGHDAWINHDRGWSCVERNDYRYMEVVK